MNLCIDHTLDRLAHRFAFQGKRGRAANDASCAGCRRVHCQCPDPIWCGVVPPGVA